MADAHYTQLQSWCKKKCRASYFFNLKIDKSTASAMAL